MLAMIRRNAGTYSRYSLCYLLSRSFAKQRCCSLLYEGLLSKRVFFFKKKIRVSCETLADFPFTRPDPTVLSPLCVLCLQWAQPNKSQGTPASGTWYTVVLVSFLKQTIPTTSVRTQKEKAWLILASSTSKLQVGLLEVKETQSEIRSPHSEANPWAKEAGSHQVGKFVKSLPNHSSNHSIFCRSSGEIAFLEGLTIVYKSSIDLFFYVVGSPHENEVNLVLGNWVLATGKWSKERPLQPWKIICAPPSLHYIFDFTFVLPCSNSHVCLFPEHLSPLPRMVGSFLTLSPNIFHLCQQSIPAFQGSSLLKDKIIST